MSNPITGGADLEVRALTRRYRDVLALDDVHVTVTTGSVHALIGPNGAGKSTLMAVLLGLARPDRGELRVGEELLADVARRVPGGVAGSVEQPRFYPYLTARQNLEALARLDADGGLPPGQVLEQLGLQDDADQKAGGLSMGMRQRLAIAAALMRRPSLLILDEPTAGLDVLSATRLLWQIRDLADQGRTILVSSHDLALVADVCDHVTILVRGRVVRSAPLEDLVNEAPPGVFRLRTSDDPLAFRLLVGVAGVRVERGRMADGLLLATDQAGLDRVLKVLVSNDVSVRELVSERAPLRILYERLTRREEAA